MFKSRQIFEEGLYVSDHVYMLSFGLNEGWFHVSVMRTSVTH